MPKPPKKVNPTAHDKLVADNIRLFFTGQPWPGSHASPPVKKLLELREHSRALTEAWEALGATNPETIISSNMSIGNKNHSGLFVLCAIYGALHGGREAPVEHLARQIDTNCGIVDPQTKSAKARSTKSAPKLLKTEPASAPKDKAVWAHAKLIRDHFQSFYQGFDITQSGWVLLHKHSRAVREHWEKLSTWPNSKIGSAILDAHRLTSGLTGGFDRIHKMAELIDAYVDGIDGVETPSTKAKAVPPVGKTKPAKADASLSVRIDPDLIRRVKLHALQEGITLAKLVGDLIEANCNTWVASKKQE